MSSEVWNIGSEIAKNWSLDIWDQEQLIFNEMFWHQQVSDPHHPELNWQGMQMIIPDPRTQQLHEEWNQCLLTQAHIIHVHGSRSAVHTAHLMHSIATKNLQIQI